jgi:alkylhydroperoxidase family enzyme
MARQLKVPAEKLDLLATWSEAGIFSAREQAALKWTETLTHIAQQGAPDLVYAALREQFQDREIVALTSAVCAINAWNRMAVALAFPPSIPQAKENAA